MNGTYWYDHDDAGIRILHALRRFRREDQAMRRRVSADMAMNESDLLALQHVVDAQTRGEIATPRSLSAMLGFSTASTTKLLDRLSASGHLERHPHPTDRRALEIRATAHAHEEIRGRLRAMHDAMYAIAADVPEDCRDAVVAFLTAMADHLHSQGSASRPGRGSETTSG